MSRTLRRMDLAPGTVFRYCTADKVHPELWIVPYTSADRGFTKLPDGREAEWSSHPDWDHLVLPEEDPHPALDGLTYGL